MIGCGLVLALLLGTAQGCRSSRHRSTQTDISGKLIEPVVRPTATGDTAATIDARPERPTGPAAGDATKPSLPAPADADRAERRTGLFGLGVIGRGETDRSRVDANLQSMMEESARRAEEARAARERVVELQRQVYLLTPAEQKPALLLSYLEDPLAAAREQALGFVGAMLSDNQPIGPELRARLRARLDDGQATVRQRAASLLADARDEPAADLIADRLASNTELNPEVLRAYLSLLARLPRAASVERCVSLLADPLLQSDAAAALASASDAGLLNARTAQQALRSVRELLAPARPAGAPLAPEPKLIELLSRLGDDSDFLRIERWLDHPDDPVRDAAARSWSRSTRSLLPLIRRSADPVIRSVALASAARRGDDPAELQALIEHRPGDPTDRAAWRSAMVALAERVPPSAVLEADRRLWANLDAADIREAVLSAAVDRLAPATSTQPPPVAPAPPLPTATPDRQRATDLARLLLARARVRAESGQHTAALPDYERAVATDGDTDLTDRERRAALVGSGRCLIALERWSDALDLLRRTSAAAATSPALRDIPLELASELVAVAERAAVDARLDFARTLTAGLRGTPELNLSADIEGRLAKLEKAIAPNTPGQAPSPPDGAATGTPNSPDASGVSDSGNPPPASPKPDAQAPPS